MKMLAYAAAVSALIGLSACGPAPMETSGAEDVNSTDGLVAAPSEAAAVETQNIVADAAVTNMLLIQASQLASTKARNADVEAFAQEVVRDHSSAGAELQQWAQTVGATLPNTLDENAAAKLSNLRDEDVPGFGDAYLDTMIEAHDNIIGRLEAYARTGQDPAVKRWATTMLPTLRTHLERARVIRAA